MKPDINEIGDTLLEAAAMGARVAKRVLRDPENNEAAIAGARVLQASASAFAAYASMVAAMGGAPDDKHS